MVMVLLSSVTAAVRAKALPLEMVAPVFMVMLEYARMCPANAVPVPSVAELPTCQYTLVSGIEVTTAELVPVVSALPTWKASLLTAT